ncbi:hypothetical protein P43SY_011337 [Pythium insidiosum]|uniref:Uncharacterized protein n=1 Tax=Pythium insidiosum TaxID=114742 RepID=A0AAD5LQ91_PYTIN|nr:hypothetical protein P43SY_011337 [Pythium insidiosum]
MELERLTRLYGALSAAAQDPSAVVALAGDGDDDEDDGSGHAGTLEQKLVDYFDAQDDANDAVEAAERVRRETEDAARMRRCHARVSSYSIA